jgi:hypothetical protein
MQEKSYKTLVLIYQATQRQISEGSNSETREKFEMLKEGTASDILARTQMFWYVNCYSERRIETENMRGQIAENELCRINYF